MKLDHLVILVSDLNASLPFYRTLMPLLGLPERQSRQFAGEGISIDLKQADDLSQGYSRYAPGLNHLGFVAESLDQLQSIRSAMAAEGHPVPELQRFHDGHAVFFADPDGMRIEVGTVVTGEIADG